MTYVHFVPDESLDSVHDALLLAFEYFGGVPQEVLFDNMKTVALERDAYGNGSHRFHPDRLPAGRRFGLSYPPVPPLPGTHQGQGRALQPLPARELLQPAAQPGESRRPAGGLRYSQSAGRQLAGRGGQRACACHARRAPDRSLASRASPADALATGSAGVWRPLLGERPRPVPHESLQHPLSVYESIREAYA